ncbi:MAG: hypothetical protein HC921_22285, partial [Synechococcaceae cyanobacterium SM2_3_1]|nr:hypothetical protein [Synechococcaceae cyanobacterium SM2_3_1]
MSRFYDWRVLWLIPIFGIMAWPYLTQLTPYNSLQRYESTQPLNSETFKILPETSVDLQQMRENLDQILLHQLRQGLYSTRNWQNGLSREEITSLLKDFPYQLPEEVITLYVWANGSRYSWWYTDDLVPSFRMLPLNEALETYDQRVELNAPDYEVWDPKWFPLFEFNGDEFLFVTASETQFPSSPVESIFLEEGTPNYRYISLAAMVASVAEAYELEAFSIDMEGKLIQNEALWSEIWARHNPALSNLTASQLESELDYESLIQINQTLGEYQLTEEVPQLLSLLETPITKTEDWSARLMVTGTLSNLALSKPAQLQDPTTINILITAFQDKPAIHREEYALIQGRLAYILGQIQAEAAVEPLIQAL